MINVSIVIPTLNERNNVLPLIKKLLHICKNSGLVGEIIIADDSKDGTAELVMETYKDNKFVRVTSGTEEKSLAKAIYRGITFTKGKIIVGMDADFNHPPELLPLLINSLKNADMVIASRFIKGGTMPNSYRFHFTYVFNFFLKHILGFPTHDNMSGYYTIRKKDLMRLPLPFIFRGYGEYHLRLMYVAKKKHMKIVEIPVQYGHRKYGHSKSNLLKMLITYTQEAIKLRFNNTH